MFNLLLPDCFADQDLVIQYQAVTAEFSPIEAGHQVVPFRRS